jgi:L,D-transpeptidase catalytic domain
MCAAMCSARIFPRPGVITCTVERSVWAGLPAPRLQSVCKGVLGWQGAHGFDVTAFQGQSMRTIFILIVLAIAGFFAWKWFAPQPASDAGAPATGTTDPATAPPFGAPPATAFGSTPVAALPAELKATYDQAEALWAEMAKNGGNPPTSPKAPLLTKLYGTVLRGLYNQEAHKGLELKLINERLTPLGDALFFSKARYPDDETGTFVMHAVAAGESPDAIAKKYGMPHELLNRMRARDAGDSKLSQGDVLKVANVREKGGNFLHIDKSDFYLDCYIAGLFARRYVISHGANESPTPSGTTRLIDRVLNPDWTDPKTKEVYRADDPRNILGKVWMKFSPDGLGQDGLGIHGYTGPNPQMQAKVSNGCVRLDTPQAQELYQLLAHPDRCPTAVVIVD